MSQITHGLIAGVIEYAERYPDKTALIIHDRSRSSRPVAYKEITYKKLNNDSNRYANGLKKIGIKRGMKVLFLVRPGLEFISLTFSLGKIGAVPIFIDPGMGKKALLKCVAEVEPDAMITVPEVLLLKWLFPRHFNSIKRSIVTKSWLGVGSDLRSILSDNPSDFSPADTTEDDPFAIVFTTGSTGTPKGVVYQHRTMIAQIETIRESLFLNENDVVLEAFAPFALRDVAMGATCLLPKMDPSKPAEVDPESIISVIDSHRPTFAFGSPAFWGRIATFCVKKSIGLPSLKNIMLAGAPVPFQLIEDLKSVLDDDNEVHTPYGATEALPLTSIGGTEILERTALHTSRGGGICVGRALHGVELKILEISDVAIEQWDEELILNVGEIGEIVVKGDMVTREYFKRPKETAMSKIRDGATIWHRMGDVGYLDEQGRLWCCGRKNHRVITGNRTILTLPCESIFNQHPAVFRSALVGVGEKAHQRPVIVIEPVKEKMPKDKAGRSELTTELLELGEQNDASRGIEDVLFHSKFPVDYRHNAKILREKLAKWAATKIR